MRSRHFLFAALAFGSLAHAEVPTGPDAINGAFARSLAHEATPMASRPAATMGDDEFEQWVNRVARGETGSAEAGFARMLERCADVPRPLAARGDNDPVAVLVADALQTQRRGSHMLASLN